MPDSELVSSRQAATILNVDRATFNRWVKAGRIEAALEMPGLTGARLFRRTDVEAMRDDRTKAAS